MKKKSNAKFNNIYTKDNKAGVTLISLVITIVVIILLSTAMITTVFDENGIFRKSKQTEDMSANLVEYEDAQLDKTMNKYANMIDETTKEKVKVLKDGSWDGTVNSPKIDGTGLIPVYYNETTGEHIELTENSTQAEWDGWYDYNTTNPKWANAITKDENNNVTGYFVWIPRYAYKIESGLYTSETGEISIKFLKDRTNYDSTNIKINTTYPEVDEENHAMLDYVVHPAFGIDVDNGGWNIDLPGFWVAKYPAGFQKNTITDNNGTLSIDISNSTDTVVYSSKNYTSYYTTYGVNALEQDLTTLPTMSLPVFKPLTYAYNNISIGDAFTLAKEVEDASNFYRLSNIDSHMLKNSEYGAIIYLTHSNYGIGIEPNINNYYANDTKESLFKCIVTGNYANSTATTHSATLGNAYYTSIGVNGSSTGNIYGIYDLNGCSWEYASALISNGDSDLKNYGRSLCDSVGVIYNAEINAMVADTGASNKYVTIYPHNSSSDTYTDNWTAYSNQKEISFGDSILEISEICNSLGGWNDDHTAYVNQSIPYFIRSGIASHSLGAGMTGIFTFGCGSGIAGMQATFRIVLTF